MQRQLSTWGTAANKSQLSRFQVEGGPAAYIPIWASGGLRTDAAQLLGNSGSPYTYGTLANGSGVSNMYDNGQVLYSLINQSTQIPEAGYGNQSPADITLLLGQGASVYDAIAQSRYSTVISYPAPLGMVAPGILVNGEYAFHATNNATGTYGASSDQFSVAGTITVTNGSAGILGAGTNFVAATLIGYGAYTPNLNAPRPGDILFFVNGGNTYFHRITSTTDATHLTMFPAATATEAGAGLTYGILRTGYGSWSGTVLIPAIDIYQSNGWLYYAGNTGWNTLGLQGAPYPPAGAPGFGTIEAVNVGSFAHAMSPLGSPSNNQLSAVDIAYYKSFLLYGAGSAISWSVAGFPTGIPFGPTDFPSGNISVIDPADNFVGFGYLGDQLVAAFTNGWWLVVPTGSVPEFAFYRLPEVAGPNLGGIPDPQTLSLIYGRPLTSARASIFYTSEEGMTKLQGGIAAHVSAPIDAYPFPAGDVVTSLSYDKATDTVLWMDGQGASGTRCLMYREDANEWAHLNMTTLTNAIGLTGSVVSTAKSGRRRRPFSVGYWNNKRLYLYATTIELGTTVTSSLPWNWATPLISLSEEYPKFTFGGFTIWARGPAGLSPANLTWTIYAGSSPYNVTSRGTGTFDYSVGSRAFDQRIGSTIDEAWIGIQLSGSSWIELAGVALWDAAATPGR